jgi:hypothetical protein
MQRSSVVGSDTNLTSSGRSFVDPRATGTLPLSAVPKREYLHLRHYGASDPAGGQSLNSAGIRGIIT